jgi:RimJ/RimL family protein N-acetyltransferase
MNALRTPRLVLRQWRPEIVSFTSVVNEASRRVMERLGMTHDPQEDFDHPSVSDGPLRRHVLYRLRR